MQTFQIKNRFRSFKYLIFPLDLAYQATQSELLNLNYLLNQGYQILFRCVDFSNQQELIQTINHVAQKMNKIEMRNVDEMWKGYICLNLVFQNEIKQIDKIQIKKVKESFLVSIINMVQIQQFQDDYKPRIIRGFIQLLGLDLNKNNLIILDNDKKLVQYGKLNKIKSFYFKQTFQLQFIINYIKKKQQILPKLKTLIEKQQNYENLDKNMFQQKIIVSRIEDANSGYKSLWQLRTSSNQVWSAQTKLFINDKKLQYAQSQYYVKQLKLSNQIFKTKNINTIQCHLCQLQMGNQTPIPTLFNLKPKQKNIPVIGDIYHILTKQNEQYIKYKDLQDFNENFIQSNLIKKGTVKYKNQQYDVVDFGNILFYDKLFSQKQSINQMGQKLYFKLQTKHKINKAYTIKKYSKFNLLDLQPENQILKSQPQQKTKQLLQFFGNLNSKIIFKQFHHSIRQQFLTLMQYYKNTGLAGISKVLNLKIFQILLIKPQKKIQKSTSKKKNTNEAPVVKTTIFQDIQARFKLMCMNYHEQIRSTIQFKWQQTNLMPQLRDRLSNKPYEFQRLQIQNNKCIILCGSNDQNNMFFKKLKNIYRNKYYIIQQINCKDLNQQQIIQQCQKKLQSISNSSIFIIFSNYNLIKNNYKINIYNQILFLQKLNQSKPITIIIGCPQYSLLSNYYSWFQSKLPIIQLKPLSFVQQYVYSFMVNYFFQEGQYLINLVKSNPYFFKYFCQSTIFQRVYTYNKEYTFIQNQSVFSFYQKMFQIWWNKLMCLGISKKIINQFQQYLILLAFRSISEKKKLIPFTNIQLYNQFKESSSNLSQCLVMFEQDHIGFLHPTFHSFIIVKYIFSQLQKQQTKFNRIRQILYDDFVIKLIQDKVYKNNLVDWLYNIVVQSKYQYNYSSIQNTRASIAISILNILNFNFSGQDFSFANIPYATLQAADIQNINLSFGNLIGTYFGKCHIMNSDFTQSNYKHKLYLQDYIQYKSKVIIKQIFILKQKRAIINMNNIINQYQWPKMIKKFQYESKQYFEKSKIYINNDYLFILRDNTRIQKWNVDTSISCGFIKSNIIFIFGLVIKKNILVVYGINKFIQIWDIAQDIIIHKIYIEGRIKVCCLNHQDNVIIGDQFNYLSLIDTNSSNLICKIKINKIQPFKYIYSFDQYFILQNQYNKIQVWKSNHQTLLFHIQISQYGPITSVSTSKISNLIAIATSCVIRIYTLPSFQFFKQISSIQYKLNSIMFDQKAKTLVGTGDSGILHIQLYKNRFKQNQYIHSGSITCFCVYNDWLISASADSQIKIWDILSMDFYSDLGSHKDIITVLKNFKHYLLSGSYDQSIKIWNLQTLQLILEINQHQNIVTTIFINPINNFIISGSKDKSLIIWKFKQTQEKLYLIKSYKQKTQGITTITFSEFLQVYLGGVQDGSVGIYSDQEYLYKYQIHSKYILNLVIPTQKKTFCISSSTDYTIKIWEISSGNILNIFSLQYDYALTMFQIQANILMLCTFKKKFMLLNTSILHEQDERFFVSFELHKKSINCMVYLSEQNLLITGSSDFSIKWWRYDRQLHKISHILSIPQISHFGDCILDQHSII